MPTIDTETFQFVALVLLGVITLVGLITLLSLSGIKKALKQRPVASLEVTARTPDDLLSATDAERAQAEADLRREAEERAAQERARLAQQQEESRRAQAEAQAQATPAAAAAPQEQPYERDGRWWFRRGDELLVYEERSGQWVAAPAAGETQPQAAVGAEPAIATAVTEQTADDPGFWKCPACGAVNGSTMSSCRMCFTQRPA